MPYRYKTRFYRIPVMGTGDILTEEQEWAQMSVIDNLLFAANFGCTNAFLEEGDYYLEWNATRTACVLRISSKSPNGFSLLGIINGRLFASQKDVQVPSLYGRAIYYVYLEYGKGLENDSTMFDIKAYLERQKENATRMALCVVNTYGNGSIDTDVGKTYAKNLLAHTMDKTNPHGEVQYQDSMMISNRLEIRGAESHGCIYRTVDSAGSSNAAILSCGDFTPLFVTASAESLEAGNVACKIEGNSIKVWNSGASGVKINVRIDVQ